EKSDASPVTEADEAANALIVERLSVLAPDIPIIAEESVAAGIVPDIGERFWLVDPLDGTREFIAGRNEYTVNIALIESRVPVLGVIDLPAKGEAYLGVVGKGAWRIVDGERRAIVARPVPAANPIAVASRSHGDAQTDAWLAEAGVGECVRAGSSAKFCVLACGKADLYPRFGRTMEWDIAAGHAILAAAGGSVTTLDGSAFLYAKPGFENPPFIARGAI
ncbi:MAG: 3'(2'),5'-bisphosphate nucleotidase CysQ, partial [Alphaproteobacteria bacterium]|nr:3'(2'),5'-bisphosphate nucleotidase CysQ [Alphaproteobacteria bacterium]